METSSDKSSQSQTYDLVIIGGGISGLGVAHEAQKQGLNFVLIDSSKFGIGTSANSHHVIHSGLRYLQTLSFSRVLESIDATNRIKEEFPQFVQDLPCLMPLDNKTPTKNLLSMKVAGILFNFLSKKKIPAPKTYSKKQLLSELPVRLPVENFFPEGAFCWHDLLLTDHNGLCREIKKRINNDKNILLEDHKVTSIEKTSDATYIVSLSGSDKQFVANTVVNTTGSKVDDIKLVNIPIVSTKLLWCRAFNVVLNKQLIPKFGIGFQSNRKRLFFFVPRSNGMTAIGTEYLPLIKGSHERRVTELELAEFLKEASTAIKQNLSLNDVSKVEVGILPVSHFKKNQPILFGSEFIEQSEGYIKVISTKYTTFLTQARKILERRAPARLLADQKS